LGFASLTSTYVYWQTESRKILKRINLLLKDIERNGHTGLGKPEPLKYQYQGGWSRRIDDEHRLVYRVGKDALEILQCRTHYE
jgi:toxin YoeB